MNKWFQILTALAVSGIAAWFSIVGMVAIFPGATISIIAMGIALEAAKIVTANTVFQKWKKLNTWFRSYFVAAVVTLSLITSLGIFGYLSKAHIEHSAAAGVSTDALVVTEGQMDILKSSIASDRQVLKQMDDAVSAYLAANDTSHMRRAVNLRANQRSERAKISADLDTLNKQLLVLQTTKSQQSQVQRQVEIDVGPLKYLAQMLYGGDSMVNTDRAARLLIGVLITVFDPLALLLLVSANEERKHAEVESVPMSRSVAPDIEPAEIPQPADIPAPVSHHATAVLDPLGHGRLDALAQTK